MEQDGIDADEHTELLGLLSQAGDILEPLADHYHQSGPLAPDDVAVVARLVEVVEAIDRALGPGKLGRLIDLVQRHEDRLEFQSAVAALDPQEAAPVLGMLTLLETWQHVWNDPTLGVLLRRLLAHEQSALAALAPHVRGH